MLKKEPTEKLDRTLKVYLGLKQANKLKAKHVVISSALGSIKTTNDSDVHPLGAEAEQSKEEESKIVIINASKKMDSSLTQKKGVNYINTGRRRSRAKILDID